MNTDTLNYLQAMDIQTWHLKPTKIPQTPTLINAMNWDELRTAVATCTACGLAKTRTQTVFGVGNQQTDLMIIGEAPGFHEDQQGEPFVGHAGQLLNAMLDTIGFNRENV